LREGSEIIDGCAMRAVTYFIRVFSVKRKMELVSVFLLFLVAVFLLLVPSKAYADNHTWQADVEEDWNVAVNWDPAQVPVAGDGVVFNGVHTGDCVINVNTEALAWFDTTGYTGEIIQSGGNITTAGDFNVYGGTLTTTNGKTITVGTGWGNFRVGKADSGVVSVDLSAAGSIDVQTGDFILYQDADDTATVIFGSQTVSINGNMIIDGTDVNSTGGTVNAGSSTIEANSHWYSKRSTADFNAGTSTVKSTVSGANVAYWSTKSSNPFNDLQKTTTGKLYMESDIEVDGNFSVDSGTFDQTWSDQWKLTVKGNFSNAGTWVKSTATPCLLLSGGGAQSFSGGGEDFGDVQISTASTDVIMTGTATFDAFTIDGSTTFELDGTAAVCTLTIASGETLANSGTLKVKESSGGTVTLQGDGGQFIYTTTDIDYNGKSLTLKYVDYRTGVTLGANETIVVGDNNCEFDAITVTAGTLDNSGDYDFTASGNWEVSGTGVFTPGTGTVTLSGASKTIKTTSDGNDAFYNLTVSGTYTLSNINMTVGNDLTITDGTMTVRWDTWKPAVLMEVGRDIIMTGGQLDAKADITVTRNITLSNDAIFYGVGDGYPTVVTLGGTFSCAGTSKLQTAYCNLASPTKYFKLVGSTGGTKSAFVGSNSQFVQTPHYSSAPRVNVVYLDNIDVQFNITRTNYQTIILAGDCQFDAITLDGNSETAFTTGANTATVEDTFTNTEGIITISDGGQIDATGYDISQAAAGIITLAGTSTLKAVNITNAGTIDLDNNNSLIDITGNITNTNTIDATATSSNIRLEGNWDNTGGTFTCASSTVTFDGSAAQALTGTLTGATGQFYNLYINNNAGTPSDVVDVDANQITVTNTLTVNDGQFQPATDSDFKDVTINTTAS